MLKILPILQLLFLPITPAVNRLFIASFNLCYFLLPLISPSFSLLTLSIFLNHFSTCSYTLSFRIFSTLVFILSAPVQSSIRCFNLPLFLSQILSFSDLRYLMPSSTFPHLALAIMLRLPPLLSSLNSATF